MIDLINSFCCLIDLGQIDHAMNIRQSWCLCTLSMLFCATAFCQTPNNNSSVDNAEKLVTQWVALEKQNTHLKSQWQDTKRLLQQRIALLKQEKSQLITLTTVNEKQVDDVSEARQKLLTLQTSMESKQAILSTWLNNQLAQVNNIHQQLPPPLANSWQTTLNELDENDVSKRLESLLSLYQSFDEFNQRVSTQQATIIDANAQEKMVHQLFLGVARGWYVTLDGTTAVAGQPSANGWQWQHNHPVSAQEVKDALAMLAHKKEARLITLPLSLSLSLSLSPSSSAGP
jgi:hypothetical protein